METTKPINLLEPLPAFYGTRQLGLPDFQSIPPEQIPEPDQKLLVHNGDMTSRLEAFYGDKLKLDVLQTWEEDNRIFREVVLLCQHTGLRVEYGAIEIVLSSFPSKVQTLIREGKKPLGAILNENAIRYSSNPRCYLAVKADTRIKQALQTEHNGTLHGRSNRLSFANGKPLASIVEILRPSAKPS